MGRKIHEVIEQALALPRAERAVVMERLEESFEQPDVPGGVIVEPQDLVELGAKYIFPKEPPRPAGDRDPDVEGRAHDVDDDMGSTR